MHGDKRRGEQFKSMLGRVGMKAQAGESIEKHEGAHIKYKATTRIG